MLSVVKQIRQFTLAKKNKIENKQRQEVMAVFFNQPQSSTTFYALLTVMS